MSFLDCMSCGFGAVILFFMILNSHVNATTEDEPSDLMAETNRLEIEAWFADHPQAETAPIESWGGASSLRITPAAVAAVMTAPPLGLDRVTSKASIFS